MYSPGRAKRFRLETISPRKNSYILSIVQETDKTSLDDKIYIFLLYFERVMITSNVGYVVSSVEKFDLAT